MGKELLHYNSAKDKISRSDEKNTCEVGVEWGESTAKRRPPPGCRRMFDHVVAQIPVTMSQHVPSFFE